MRGILNIIFVLGLLFSYLNGQSQYKNNKWIVGMQPDLLMEFGKDSTINKVYTAENQIKYRNAVANINDTGIILSCNAYNIYDKYGSLMDGGYHIIPDKVINSSQGGSAGRATQQTIILPKKNNEFYVFIWSISDKNFDVAQTNGGTYIYDILTYCIVDMNENNGKGKVLSKLNYLIQNDSLSISQMSAVKHANGRDWWLVKPHFSKHKFYIFIVTPNGIIQKPIQEFDSPVFINGINGQSNFSPDGSLYAMTSESSIGNFSQINYFDRCTGKMTKLKTLYSPFESFWNDTARINSICISSNNRFVYLVNNFFIYQYDLTNDEIIELHTDSLYNQCEYKSAYNASDGRIYIGNFLRQCDAMSYIEFPNNKGKAAGLCQLCYKTKNNNTAIPPNMPNYELGALVGSVCDTIKQVTVANESPIIVPNVFSPNGDGKNDTWHILNVPQLQLASITIQAVGVYNRWGNEVFKSSDINFEWDAKGWASDSYYYYIRYRTKAGTSQVQKGGVSVVR